MTNTLTLILLLGTNTLLKQELTLSLLHSEENREPPSSGLAYEPGKVYFDPSNDIGWTNLAPTNYTIFFPTNEHWKSIYDGVTNITITPCPKTNCSICFPRTHTQLTNRAALQPHDFFPTNIAIFNDIAERHATLSNVLYKVEYHYNKSGNYFRPNTLPAGQAHYPAKATVLKSERIAPLGLVVWTLIGNVDCQYTESGCFEDDPILLIRRALGSPMDNPEYSDYFRTKMGKGKYP